MQGIPTLRRMITIDCPCGQRYHADPQHAGKRIRCHNCMRVLPIVPKRIEPQPPLRTSRPPTSLRGLLSRLRRMVSRSWTISTWIGRAI